MKLNAFGLSGLRLSEAAPADSFCGAQKLNPLTGLA
jgi:hypothetical protein